MRIQKLEKEVDALRRPSSKCSTKTRRGRPHRFQTLLIPRRFRGQATHCNQTGGVMRVNSTKTASSARCSTMTSREMTFTSEVTATPNQRSNFPRAQFLPCKNNLYRSFPVLRDSRPIYSREPLRSEKANLLSRSSSRKLSPMMSRLNLTAASSRSWNTSGCQRG